MKLQSYQTNAMEICFNNEEIKTASLNSSIDDHMLKASVVRCLSWYSRVPLNKVNISVYHGYVILTGIVPLTYQRVVTSKMFENVKGMRGLVNNIHVVKEVAA